MNWRLSHRADEVAREIADRHYNRQKVGTPQFVPPGRCLVLVSNDEKAFWVTSWPFAEYVRHAWPGAWVCSAFRNERSIFENGPKSSDLIREAVSATRAEFGEPPAIGMITFVDRRKVKPKRDPGRCFLRAGFKYARRKNGEYIMTKGGLVVLRMLPHMMPPPESANPYVGELFRLTGNGYIETSKGVYERADV